MSYAFSFLKGFGESWCIYKNETWSDFSASFVKHALVKVQLCKLLEVLIVKKKPVSISHIGFYGEHDLRFLRLVQILRFLLTPSHTTVKLNQPKSKWHMRLILSICLPKIKQKLRLAPTKSPLDTLHEHNLWGLL